MTTELAEIAAAEGRNHAYLLSGTCPCACCSRLPRPTRPTPGALDPPEGPVVPAPSSKQPRYFPPQHRPPRFQPHSPACGRNSKAKPPAAPKPPHKCLDCPVMVPAHWLRCEVCGKVKHREQSTAAQKRLYWRAK